MIFWLAMLACSDGEPTVADNEQSFALIYTANVHGEIEPCG